MTQPTILVVDDTKENLMVIGQALRSQYEVRIANSGRRALQILEEPPLPDLILLDIMMPEMDGYAVIETLKQNPATRDIPVIFVTAMNADEDEERGFQRGAVDYVSKPIRPALLLARVRTHLELKASRDRLQHQNAYLDAEVRRRTLENELVKDFSLNALATLAEKRDNETGNHLHRTQAYVRALMDQLRNHPRFCSALSDPEGCERIAKAAPLHDIGKVGIPDAILLKPGKLTAEEFAVMKTHTSIGAQAIADAICSVQRSQPAPQDVVGPTGASEALAFLKTVQEVAGGHHEKWDGTGYPQGLAGETIPLGARLMALADVFDALVSKRHYKPAFSFDDAIGIISAGRGHHFDPDITDAFLAHSATFVDIATRYADHHPEQGAPTP